MPDTHETYQFAGLPAAFVDALFEGLGALGETTRSAVGALSENRGRIRAALGEKGVLQAFAGPDGDAVPTSCAVAAMWDASTVLSTDIALSAAFAVEGLVSTGGTGQWNQPRHRVAVLDADPATGEAPLAGTLSIELALELGGESGHDIVFTGQPLRAPAVGILEAMPHGLRHRETPLGKAFVSRLKHSLMGVEAIGGVEDKTWCAIPVTPPAFDLSPVLGLENACEDRVAATMLLDAGEFTAPVPAAADDLRRIMGIAADDEKFTAVRDRLVRALKDIRAVYFRPHAWMPALRVEVPAACADDGAALGGVLAAISFQSENSGLDRPYPLAGVESMTDGIRRALPALRRRAVASVIEWGGGDCDVLTTFLNERDRIGGT